MNFLKTNLHHGQWQRSKEGKRQSRPDYNCVLADVKVKMMLLPACRLGFYLSRFPKNIMLIKGTRKKFMMGPFLNIKRRKCSSCCEAGIVQWDRHKMRLSAGIWGA